jgi:Mg-chelatase subunit ChlD
VVEPTAQVTSRVVVRAAPDPKSRDVGSLARGSRAEHLGGVDGWRRVRLADGTVGFVSEPWTRLAPGTMTSTAPAPRPEAKPKASGFGWFRSEPETPKVEIAIRDPASATYRNTDPDLPVSGLARLANSGNYHDIVLALDTSTSTNEPTGIDVNGDGVVDRDFKGQDSIHAAQIQAARGFVRALRGLPRNQGGERVRLAIVTYAGAETLHLHPPDANLELGPELVYSLGARDASTRVPLTSDYAAVERALDRLAKQMPIGMTDVAAGIGRGLVELEGLSVQGALSQPREAQKVILFLTDGRPRLPYGPDQAERAALYAGKLASEAGIRINAFALGRDRVTRKPNAAVKRMARRSGGRFTELDQPGDVIAVLEQTPFSIVDRVKLANRTTGTQSRAIATALDGSFYGEIPLREGQNEIEVEAILTNGEHTTHVFSVAWVNRAPEQELEAQLRRIRMENEALIQQIKAELALDIERTRKRQKQKRSLSVTPLPAKRQP